MAILLGCENLHLEYATRKLFESVTLGIEEGDRIGIVGRNGDGKSSLLAMLAGTLDPDAGTVTLRNGVRIGVLRQTDALDPTATIGWSIVGDTPEYVWASDARVRGIIEDLVGDLDWNALVGELSGGQRRRVDLARVLIGDHDILLLDEPTNHLDMHTIAWLANHLKSRWPRKEGAMLVVTHDRWFLDEVCTGMWEVHDAVVEPFEGGYSAYVLQRVEREEAARVAEQKRRNLMRIELAWLSRGARARATKPKFHVETARALIADVPPPRDTLELKRAAISRLGKQVVDLEEVTLRYTSAAPAPSDTADAGVPARPVIDSLSWIIGPGDRYGILGENGAGKTTLLELISGALLPTRGRVKIGKTVKFAILTQELEELREVEDDRVREVIARYKTNYVIGGKEVTPTQLLERLGFNRQHINTRIKDLSGGQRRRLQLMLILLDRPNVLILDEPGNDLDTDMLAAVEDLLDTWPGTLLLVTHDRYLMERVTDDQFALIDGRIRHCPRGVDEYLELVDARREARKEAGRGAGAGAGSSAKNAGGGSGAKSTGDGLVPTDNTPLSAAQVRDIKKQLNSLERRIGTLTGKKEKLVEKMHDADPSDYQTLVDLGKQQQEIEEQIAALEDEWMELSEPL